MSEPMLHDDHRDDSPSAWPDDQLILTDEEMERFSEAVVDLLVMIENNKLTPLQCMINWAVKAAHYRREPYDKSSIAMRLR